MQKLTSQEYEELSRKLEVMHRFLEQMQRRQELKWTAEEPPLVIPYPPHVEQLTESLVGLAERLETRVETIYGDLQTLRDYAGGLDQEKTEVNLMTGRITDLTIQANQMIKDTKTYTGTLNQTIAHLISEVQAVNKRMDEEMTKNAVQREIELGFLQKITTILDEYDR